ncbi:MAG: 4Fe-4S binding protein [Candidatus Hadarchaeaceae archaeon]
MVHDYKKTGVLAPKDLEEIIPPSERFKKGPVAIVECVQEIPCDACVQACPQKFISKKNLVALPKLDFDKCSGCAICVGKCPGLAIFIVDKCKAPKGKAWITIPYEFLPVPKVGDVVRALNREGKDVGSAKVVKVVRLSKEEKTALVTFEVDEELAMEARALRR